MYTTKQDLKEKKILRTINQGLQSRQKVEEAQKASFSLLKPDRWQLPKDQ